MDDERFMSMAIEEARRGAEASDGGPFGAVLVVGGEVLSRAHNTVLRDNDPTRHAEITAISLAAQKCKTYDLKGCTVYTTTEPCPMCFSAVHWAGGGRIVYGTTIEDVKKLGFNELAIPAAKMKEYGKTSIDIRGGFMRFECMDLLKFWEGIPDKKVY